MYIYKKYIGLTYQWFYYVWVKILSAFFHFIYVYFYTVLLLDKKEKLENLEKSIQII